MDSLDAMLTDSMELGPCVVNNGTRIMEECMLGGTRVSLPEDLLEDPELFFDVVSLDTWQNVLSDSQREHLKQFLPCFPEDNANQQEQIIHALFKGDNFRFGNPLQIAQKLFRDGHFNPEVVKYRQLCLKSQYKRYVTTQQQYFHKLLTQILASRKELLDLARKNGPDFVMKRKPASLRNTPEERERLAQRRYLKILREVKEECGDGALSSEEEDLSSWLPSSSTHSPSVGVPLRVIPTLSTQDMKTADKLELDNRDLKLLLRRHREKRKRQPDHPDLMTDNVTMDDIMTRANAGRKGSLAALFDLATIKKRVKERDKKKKMKVIKTEVEDFPEPPERTDLLPPLLPPDSPPMTLTAVKEEPLEDVKPPLPFNEISASFFCLLLDILMMEGPCSIPLLEDKVADWQSSPASTLNSWFSAAPNWCDLVHSALFYLSGESKGASSSFAPFVEFREKTQQWKCIGSSLDNEKELVALFQLWLETKDQIFCKDNEDSIDSTTPVPRVTDFIVRPSSWDEKRVFQEQERHRYSQPHKAFTFRMHGFESVVGPVKGVFDKETSLNKAREHSLLRSDRPAYVTILSLVRDAAARLPNGEGTRAEICELLKDSQFLAPDVTSAQVNTVVSGALDRLHYEKDPCVKYDIGRKLWIYLHRDRSEEEFERIHQAQAAVAKAKKAQQQKPKPPAKVKSSKECSIKISGTPEPGQLNLNDSSSMPATPGTPGTPTPPALPATPMSPTSAAVSKIVPSTVAETPKPSPSVLLVSSPTMPQLSTLLSPSVTSQTAPVTPTPVRTTALSSTSGLPQVRIVTTSTGIPATAPAAIVTQPLSSAVSHIRLPATSTPTPTKVFTQTQMVTMPVKAPTSVCAPATRPTLPTQGGITVTALSSAAGAASKSVVSSPGGSGPTILQSITGQSIIKQVALSGQLGMKAQAGASLPLSTTNFRIQGKDVLRLPPSSITTDAKGQTILRITPDMMATLAKSQVTAVKLSQELFTAAPGGSSGKGLLHMASNPSSPSPPATIKVNPDIKPAEPSTSSFRLMPALGVTVADQKVKAASASDSKPPTTIRIVQGLGVVPPKATAGQSITVSAKPISVVSSNVVSSVQTATTVSIPTINSMVTKPAPTALTMGTTTVRQFPVSTTQQGKLPARITVPLSVLSQPMKGKSVMTAPIIKGSLGANISGLGRNIILTTVPAGTKLIAGNKPVSFLTAQQLQQLQQQGQATQVRIQTVPASHLQQGSSPVSSKAVSTVVVTTAPPPKPTQEPQ
ncbi:nuclear factor related to kappa-B-binding protein isoform X2 [Bombina bombina]|uniref:nuclear factor related to kappa-B-binding protein isoform X2 n=1 Tax=Bombina bombina TaxID=8345 RepID=UPI00235B2101|nr:nuclear factor related to kappa-B-binding protein isoform X2 [Bombina bombina]